MQNYRKIIRPHLITKHPMTEKKTLKKLSTTPPDTKTQNRFVEKGNVYPGACWLISCGADNSVAEVRKKWRLPNAYRKKLQNRRIKYKLGARMNADLDWFIFAAIHISESYWPQFLQADPVLLSVPAKWLFLSVPFFYTFPDVIPFFPLTPPSFCYFFK